MSARLGPPGWFTVPPALLEVDAAVELYREFEPRDFQRDRGRELLITLDRAARPRLGDGLLDLALRSDPHHLQELANAQIETVIVHGCPLVSVGPAYPSHQR